MWRSNHGNTSWVVGRALRKLAQPILLHRGDYITGHVKIYLRKIDMQSPLCSRKKYGEQMVQKWSRNGSVFVKTPNDG
jgi:hypothetical protein